MKEVWYIAKRFLLPKDRRSFRSLSVLLSTLGIFCATALVMLSLGVLSGYQSVYRDAVLNFSSHIIITRDFGVDADSSAELEKTLIDLQKKTKFEYSPYHFHEALAPSKQGLKTIIFKGVDFKKLKEVYPVKINIVNKDQKGVFVGQDLASEQGDMLKTGKLKYLSLRDPEGGIQSKLMSMPVVGTFSSGYYDFDSQFVLMPLDTLMQQFNQQNVSGYELRLSDIDQVESLKKQIFDRVYHEFDILTWDELNRSLFEALKLDRTVVFAVSIMVLAIACLNIFGFNFLFFIGRQKDFMILSALGFGLKRLRRLLAVISFCLGGIAAILGALLGIAGLLFLMHGPGIPLDPKVYFVDHIPVNLVWPWFFAFTLATLILCYVTSLIAGKIVLRRYFVSLS
jgi:lipoprotein-releasing system permease protein